MKRSISVLWNKLSGVAKRGTASLCKKLFVDEYNCIVCDAEYFPRNPLGVCEKCLPLLEFNDKAHCKRCGRALIEDEYCLLCQKHKREFDRAYSPFVYEGTVEQLVQRFKFFNNYYYAKYFANSMVEEIKKRELQFDILTYVPDFEEKKNAFYSSRRLADEIASKLGVQVVKLVEKTRETDKQHLLSLIERESSLTGAFKLMDKNAVRDKRILIVDDVLTTGKTMSEMAAAIKRGKPTSVEAITFASVRQKLQKEI